MSSPPIVAPPAITTSNIWDLKADPGVLSRAAQGWADLATGAHTNARAVEEAVQGVYARHWEGEAADSYHRHEMRLTDDVEKSALLAERAARALEAAASALTTAQSSLTGSLESVPCPREVSGDVVTFRPATEKHVDAVTAAIHAADQIRTALDDSLDSDVHELVMVRPGLAEVAAAWRSVAQGLADPFAMPDEAPGPGTIYDYANNRFIINTGTGDDTVEVHLDSDGHRTVRINGVDYRVPDGMNITVRTGEGDDRITVPAGTPINLTLLGGEGDDSINGGGGNDRVLAGDGEDTVQGGSGNDNISGGGDRDYINGEDGNDILAGGSGNDTVYGLSGNDRISGGEGRDYLEGATGNDSIDGGGGEDSVSGGRDDDTLFGGSGDDVIYGGDGTDTVAGGRGRDTAYIQGDDRADVEQAVTVEISDLGGTIEIDGSPEFVERVQADLDMLRSSPRGQLMLAELDRLHNDSGAIAEDWPLVGGIAYQGDTVRIVETPDANGYAGNDQNPAEWVFGHDNYKIQYNPRFQDVEGGPPVTTLFHEMAHVYDYGNDTSADGSYDNPADPDQMLDDDGDVVGVPNDEREAAGLPIDPDGDGHYEIYPDHPFDYTENGLRDELGVQKREKYGF